MFKKIRNRLTFYYTGLMILFLLTFTILTYFLLSQFLYHDSKEKAIQLAQWETKEHTKDFIKWSDRKSKKIEIESPEAGFSRSFYILVTKEGQLMKATAPSSLLQPANLNKILQRKPNPGEVHFMNLLLENKTIHVALTGLPVYHEGKFLGTVYSGTDISEQRHILDQLLWVLAGLSLIFVLLSSLLSYFMAEKAMTPIIRAFRRQQEFVADASHELRTPLSVIYSSLEVLASEKQKSAFSQQVLDDLMDEIKSMTKLVSDLLTLARIDSGVLELMIQTINVREHLEGIIRSFQPLAAKKNIQLSLEIMVSDIHIAVDPERIRQLLYILLDNALRYTPEKGTIKVCVRPSSGVVPSFQIEVADTGIGIERDQIKRIFDRFYRTDKARSRTYGGTGLGLSIAQWIVQSHGGTIDVESTPGKGTRFTIRLPIQKQKGKP